MKILVTGGTGFIGSRLVKRLKRKNKVKEVTVLSTSKKGEKGKVKFVKGDISNPYIFNKINPVDVVFHLASIIDEEVPIKKMRKVNVKGTDNVLNFCKKKNVNQLVHVSTVGVYGKIKNPPANEDTSYNPQTNYEQTKCEAEKLVLEYKNKSDTNLTIFRPTMVYGPNSYWLEILKKAKKKFPLIGNGNNHFHTLYVKNLVEALLLALKNKKSYGKIYNVADEKVHTYKESYKIMCEELGVEFPDKEIPIWLAKSLAWGFEIKGKITGKSPLITKTHIERLIRERYFDISKIKKELNYKPKWDFRKGIRETIQELNL